MKILVAADGSEYTQRILEFVERRGWLTKDNELTVFTVVLPFPSRAANFADPVKVREYYDEEAQTVHRVAGEWFLRHGFPATFAHEIGSPAECIARKATGEHYDLIAMGSRGHGTLGTLVPGSVAAKVMATCKTPVLLVP